MKQKNRILKMIALVLVLSVLSPSVLPISNVKVVQAATIKLSKSSLTLEVGDTATLRVNGTKLKATWSTSNKAVATVNSSGKVTAKKEGKATITATVNKKKYTCKVSVTMPVNPFITYAPFEAQEAVIGKVHFILPKDWTNTVLAQENNNVMSIIYPSNVDYNAGTSNITISVQETGETTPDYSSVKEYLQTLLTADYLKGMLATGGIDAEISNIVTSDYEAILGKTFVTEYDVTATGSSMHQLIADLYVDNYLIEVTVTDIGDSVTPDIYTICQYMLDTTLILP